MHFCFAHFSPFAKCYFKTFIANKNTCFIHVIVFCASSFSISNCNSTLADNLFTLTSDKPFDTYKKTINWITKMKTEEEKKKLLFTFDVYCNLFRLEIGFAFISFLVLFGILNIFFSTFSLCHHSFHKVPGDKANECDDEEWKIFNNQTAQFTHDEKK